ncbi:unnamed protein product [Discosporangium mesarthrocarpum]
MSVTAAVNAVQSRLNAIAVEKTRSWWTNYVKGACFRGVNMAGVRKTVHAVHKELDLASLTPNQRLELFSTLLSQDMTEDKMAGIIYAHEVMLPQREPDWNEGISEVSRLFSQGFVADWNTCDWLCVKVLGNLVKQHGESCYRAISDWRFAGSLWQRRASCVAFVNLAKMGDAGNFTGFTDMLLENCEQLISAGPDERFAQTGAGWVLRELGQVDRAHVVDLLKRRAGLLSLEGLRYATEKMPVSEQKRLKAHHQRANAMALRYGQDYQEGARQDGQEDSPAEQRGQKRRRRVKRC